jgi:hypothetical protein
MQSRRCLQQVRRAYLPTILARTTEPQTQLWWVSYLQIQCFEPTNGVESETYKLLSLSDSNGYATD